MSPEVDTWHEAETPNGSKFRYTMEDGKMGRMEMIYPPPQEWVELSLPTGRKFWQKTGTKEITYVNPNLQSTVERPATMALHFTNSESLLQCGP